jgi:hypothetical protein
MFNRAVAGLSHPIQLSLTAWLRPAVTQCHSMSLYAQQDVLLDPQLSHRVTQHLHREWAGVASSSLTAATPRVMPSPCHSMTAR